MTNDGQNQKVAVEGATTVNARDKFDRSFRLGLRISRSPSALAEVMRERAGELALGIFESLLAAPESNDSNPEDLDVRRVFDALASDDSRCVQVRFLGVGDYVLGTVDLQALRERIRTTLAVLDEGQARLMGQELSVCRIFSARKTVALEHLDVFVGHAKAGYRSLAFSSHLFHLGAVTEVGKIGSAIATVHFANEGLLFSPGYLVDKSGVTVFQDFSVRSHNLSSDLAIQKPTRTCLDLSDLVRTNLGSRVQHFYPPRASSARGPRLMLNCSIKAELTQPEPDGGKVVLNKTLRTVYVGALSDMSDAYKILIFLYEQVNKQAFPAECSAFVDIDLVPKVLDESKAVSRRVVRRIKAFWRSRALGTRL